MLLSRGSLWHVRYVASQSEGLFYIIDESLLALRNARSTGNMMGGRGVTAECNDDDNVTC